MVDVEDFKNEDHRRRHEAVVEETKNYDCDIFTSFVAVFVIYSWLKSQCFPLASGKFGCVSLWLPKVGLKIVSKCKSKPLRIEILKCEGLH